MEYLHKVVRLNENPMGDEEEVTVDDGGDERDENEISDMDKLPNEILTKILDYLDEQELVKYRLLCSRWNEICCLLLPEKTKNKWDSKLVVGLEKSHGKESLECKTVIQRSFDEFLDCFAMTEAEKSIGSGPRPFPFSRFKIAGLFFMERNQMIHFVSLFFRIKKLTFDVKKKDLKNFGKFWRLLLKHAPNIENLEMNGVQWCKVELFEPNFNFKASSNPFKKNIDATQIKGETFLDKLKVFQVRSEHLRKIESCIESFLKHTPSVQELILLCESPDSNDWDMRHPLEDEANNTFEVVRIWQKINRAHLIKKLDINPISKSHLPPAELMKNLHLEDLTADCRIPNNPVGNEKSTINYIHHALKSSQVTLSSLNLINVTLESIKFCFKDIKSLPNVRHLELEYAKETGNVLERFSHLCPNIKSLKIQSFHGDFSNVARILWTRFTGLKTLKLDVGMTGRKVDLLLVDSEISGYSQESIVRIQSKLKEGIYLEEARRNEKQNPSILDLKDLNRLELQFGMGRRTFGSRKLENQLRNSLFIKILPQHIRENPRSILYDYNEY